MNTFFAPVEEKDLSFLAEESNVFDCLSKLYKSLGGRTFVLKTDGYANSRHIASTLGFKKHKILHHFVSKATKDTRYLKKLKSGAYQFTEAFRNAFFGDKVFDHHKYPRPVRGSRSRQLTDGDILLLLCWYRDGKTFSPNIDLTSELAFDIGLPSSRTLRQAVDRLMENHWFRVLCCKGRLEALQTSMIFCSFKDQTIKTVFGG